MPITVSTVVTCDRCARVIPSGITWPYTWGPPGPQQRAGLICVDIPNSCKDLVATVFFHVARVIGPATDALG